MKRFRIIIFILIFMLAACKSPGTPMAITSIDDVTMQSGLWIGTFTEGDERTMEMTLDVRLDGSSISGEMQIHDESVTNIQPILGTVQGSKVQFKDEANHLYWGVLTEDGIEGFVGWECFDCSHWGTFKLGYAGRSNHIDLTPFATLNP